MILDKLDENRLNMIQKVGLVVGILASLACAGWVIFVYPGQFFEGYLFAYLFWLSLTLGSFAIAMLHYLVGGAWGIVIRRVVEAGTKTLWLMALLFIPIVVGLHTLYSWSNPAVVQANELLQHKSPYLNVPFFIIRAVIYFALWGGFAFILTRWSQNPQHFTDNPLRRRFQRMSSFGIIVYFIAMSFASVDWIMSLQPEWVSTIFGMLIVVEQSLTGLCFGIFMTIWLAREGEAPDLTQPRNYRDLGALLLTTVILTAYMAFSQLIIIWSANIPKEVTWYLVRTTGGWLWVELAALILLFVLPFIILLSPQTKRNPWILFWLAASVIAASLLEVYWQVIPVFHPTGFVLPIVNILTPLAIGGFWLAAFVWHLRRTPQVEMPEINVVEGIQAPSEEAAGS